ncbi:MAG: RNA methyltransferase, partial [Gammaproteobacteria bacterium]
MDITSPQNTRVKHIVKLREDKRQRQRDQLMLVEGYDELMLAVASGLQPQTIFTAPELASRQMDGLSAETLTVNRAVFEKMSYRENPDGWLGVFPIPGKSLDDLKPGPT